MASKVVNLRAARKRKARDETALQASENRVKFGRTKAEKKRDQHESETARGLLDQHHIERSDEN
jgi:hypothetical protein